MIVLFVPKTLPFDWENQAFTYLPFKFSMPFMRADGVRVLDPTSTQGAEFLQSVYYMILNETEYTRSYKFYLNVRGYIKVIKGTENTTLESPPGSRNYGDYEKFNYYPTDEENELGLQYTKKVWRWAINVRKTERLKNLSEQFAEEYTSIVNSVLSEIESATTVTELGKIAHTKLGAQTTDLIIEQYNLSTPTLLI
jgi:hypothetical protein